MAASYALSNRPDALNRIPFGCDVTITEPP